MPALFLWFLGKIKGTSDPEVYGGDVPVSDTPVPTYGDLQTFALHPNVLCYDNNLFFRYKQDVHYHTIGVRLAPQRALLRQKTIFLGNNT